MGTFIQAENFSKITPYFKLFLQGTAVTVMLSIFTVIIGCGRVTREGDVG